MISGEALEDSVAEDRVLLMLSEGTGLARVTGCRTNGGVGGGGVMVTEADFSVLDTADDAEEGESLSLLSLNLFGATVEFIAGRKDGVRGQSMKMFGGTWIWTEKLGTVTTSSSTVTGSNINKIK